MSFLNVLREPFFPASPGSEQHPLAESSFRYLRAASVHFLFRFLQRINQRKYITTTSSSERAHIIIINHHARPHDVTTCHMSHVTWHLPIIIQYSVFKIS